MLQRPLVAMVDAWIARAARPDPAAVARIAGLKPLHVIVGGSEGIGLAMARRLVGEGQRVLLVARSPDKLARAAASLSDSVQLVLDATAPDALSQIDEAAARAGCWVDVLIVAAAMGLAGPFAEHDTDDVDRLVALDVAAATRLVHRALGPMLARGRGGILVVSSLGGYAPGPWQAAYYASAAYKLALMEAIAHENRGRGVRLAVAAPGPVETSFHAKMGSEASLYRWLVPSMSADAVAASMLRGYRLGHTVIRPGLIATLFSLAMRVIPHPLLVPLIGVLLKLRGR